jgi:hypothetical protein
MSRLSQHLRIFLGLKRVDVPYRLNALIFKALALDFGRHDLLDFPLIKAVNEMAMGASPRERSRANISIIHTHFDVRPIFDDVAGVWPCATAGMA